MTIDGVINRVLGREFEIECSTMEVRAKGDREKPCFSGPGSIRGDIDGAFSFRLYDASKKNSGELLRLFRLILSRSEAMGFSAVDYDGVSWTGTWFNPKVQVSPENLALVTGEFTQLNTRMKLCASDALRNTTVNYYHGLLRLPMLSGVRVQHIRGSNVEREEARRDKCELAFDGAAIKVCLDEEIRALRFLVLIVKDWLHQSVKLPLLTLLRL
jgi:hypothetical protein